MSAVDEALAPSQPDAGRSLYGANTWVAYHTASNTTLAAKHAAVAGQYHIARQIVVTADAATAGVNVLTVKDGTTVIFTANLPTSIQTSPVIITFPGGLQASVDADITVGMTSTGNSANATVWMTGYSQLGN